MKRTKSWKINISLIAFLLAAMVTSIAVGSVRIPLKETLLSLFGSTLPNSYIIRSIRLPRILGCALSGAVLALSGVVFQAAFNNPLADPYLLGVSSGSTFTIALATFLGLSTQTVVSLPLSAFAGGLGASAITLFIARRRQDALILSGIALSGLFSALTSLLIYMKRNELSSVYFWAMGGFSSMTRQKVFVLIPVLILLWILVHAKAPQMDLLLVDESSARSMGLVPSRFRTMMLVAATLATSVAVSYSGTIGFAGILAPHIARMLSGSSHRKFISTSALMGALVLVLADMVARTILMPAEIPVGIITALLGSPLFLYLALGRKR